MVKMSAQEVEVAPSVVPAVARATQILDLLGEVGTPLSSNEIARRLNIPKSSTANICLELESAGMLVRRENGYDLGRKLVELGGKYLASIDALREYYDLCSSLPLLSRESSRLAILDGTDVLYLGKYEGRKQIRLTANIGDRFPAVCTATGKALMALLPEGEVKERYKGNPGAFMQLTEKSIKNVAELEADLKKVRQRGYAIDDEEATLGVVCFAISISGFRGDTSSFAVSVTLLKNRMTNELKQLVLNDLAALARGLSNPLVNSSRAKISYKGLS
jgi:DNA-binding IclR family transcriptional regulator